LEYSRINISDAAKESMTILLHLLGGSLCRISRMALCNW